MRNLWREFLQVFSEKVALAEDLEAKPSIPTELSTISEEEGGGESGGGGRDPEGDAEGVERGRKRLRRDSEDQAQPRPGIHVVSPSHFQSTSTSSLNVEYPVEYPSTSRNVFIPVISDIVPTSYTLPPLTRPSTLTRSKKQVRRQSSLDISALSSSISHTGITTPQEIGRSSSAPGPTFVPYSGYTGTAGKTYFFPLLFSAFHCLKLSICQ